MPPGGGATEDENVGGGLRAATDHAPAEVAAEDSASHFQRAAQQDQNKILVNPESKKIYRSLV